MSDRQAAQLIGNEAPFRDRRAFRAVFLENRAYGPFAESPRCWLHVVQVLPISGTDVRGGHSKLPIADFVGGKIEKKVPRAAGGKTASSRPKRMDPTFCGVFLSWFWGELLTFGRAASAAIVPDLRCCKKVLSFALLITKKLLAVGIAFKPR